MSRIGSECSRVASALKEMRRRSARYRDHFGFVRGWRYGILDRPGAKGTMAVSIRGFPKMVVRRGDSDLRTLCHVLCEQGYEFPFPVDPSPGWIIDAGANTGMASVYFAERYPKARILAVEPDPDNFDLLRRNVSHYGDRVKCIQAALWSRVGEVNLLDPGQGSWAMRVGESGAESTAVERLVSALTVDELIAAFGMDRVSILKVDIEGGESAVFKEPSAWIRDVDSIAIELHDRFVSDCSDVFARATREFSERATRGEDTFVGR